MVVRSTRTRWLAERSWAWLTSRRGSQTLGYQFTSIDPLAEKYYSISPYAYCLNNPVKYVDNDGRDILIWYKNDKGTMSSYQYAGAKVSHTNNYVKKVVNAINYNIDNGEGSPSKAAITNRDIIINIYETDGKQQHSSGTAYWNPELGTQHENGIVVSPATVLDHEFDHGVQYATDPEQHRNDTKPNSDKKYDTKEE